MRESLENIVKILKQKNEKVTCMESCTGRFISK